MFTGARKVFLDRALRSHRAVAADRALAAIAVGRPVVALDGEIGGFLVVAADAITPEVMAFIVRHSSGLVCVAVPDATLSRLDIPTIPNRYGRQDAEAFAVSVDAGSGITTGISAADRARTARVLADPSSGPKDLVRPGHLIPMRARDGGVLDRAGQAEVAVDLVRLAGHQPAGVLAAIVDDGGEIRSPSGCRAFAEEHGLEVVSIHALRAYRRRQETVVTRALTARVPTTHGVMTVVTYENSLGGGTHLALTFGLPADGSASDGVSVRVHTGCSGEDRPESPACDYAAALDSSIKEVGAAGRGIVLCLRGRGLPEPGGLEEYAVLAMILRDLGVCGLRLVTDDPWEAQALRREGFVVDQVALSGKSGSVGQFYRGDGASHADSTSERRIAGELARVIIRG